jgi:hypothetical protein
VVKESYLPPKSNKTLDNAVHTVRKRAPSSDIRCLQMLTLVQHKENVNALVYKRHIIGWQHARLTRSLDESGHPALINWSAVHNEVTIPE